MSNVKRNYKLKGMKKNKVTKAIVNNATNKVTIVEKDGKATVTSNQNNLSKQTVVNPDEWNRVAKHFGEVAPNETFEYTFKYYGDKKYARHEASCSCITSEWKDNSIKLSFTIKEPDWEVLEKAGRNYSETYRTITVMFTDGSVAKLSLKAFVLPKSLIENDGN